jgi:hypothetical protein
MPQFSLQIILPCLIAIESNTLELRLGGCFAFGFHAKFS